MNTKTQFFAVAVVVVCFGYLCAGQNAPASLEEQLKGQYKLVRLGADGGGQAVIEPGVVLDIQKGGVLGVPGASMAMCPAKYQNGDLNVPSKLCIAMVGGSSRFFQVGDRVYASKIEVNLDKDKISFRIVACDSCNNVNPPTFYKSEVLFQFPKGELKTKTVPQVEDVIAQVFSIDQGGGAQQQDQTAQGGDQQAQAQPQTVELGQTVDQVVGALGQPDKIVNLGAKQLYVYKDLKVTFMSGKVSDVQ